MPIAASSSNTRWKRLFCGVAAFRASRPPRHTTATFAMAASPVRSDMNSIQPGAKPLGQFHGVVVGPEMNEERARLVVEHVVVNRGDLDAIVLQRLDERIDLARERHEVASNGRLAVARRLKIDGDRRAHRAGNRHAVLLDAVRARHAVLIDPVIVAALLRRPHRQETATPWSKAAPLRGTPRRPTLESLALSERRFWLVMNSSQPM